MNCTRTRIDAAVPERRQSWTLSRWPLRTCVEATSVEPRPAAPFSVRRVLRSTMPTSQSLESGPKVLTVT